MDWSTMSSEDKVFAEEVMGYLEDIAPKTDFKRLRELMGDGTLEQFGTEFQESCRRWIDYSARVSAVISSIQEFAGKFQFDALMKCQSILEEMERSSHERDKDRSREGGG